MKKNITFLLIILFISYNSLFATTNIKGEFNLNGLLNIDNSFNSTFNSTANLSIFLNSSSNNVKYTLKDTVSFSINPQNYNYETTNEIEQAYLKFRIPFNSNYLTFNFGKTPLDIGGDWQFNSGDPFVDIDYSSPLSLLNTFPANPWIASAKTRLFSLEDFQSINLELLAQLPVEDSIKKIGARLTYDVNNTYFGTFESSFLANSSKATISGGFNGTLYFDYGIYGKTDLLNLDDYEASIYLLKMYSDFTIKFEGVYDNETTQFILLPTASYTFNTKNTVNFILGASYINPTWTLYPTVSLTQNIVQGLDFSLSYSYLSSGGSILLLNITHKF